VFAFLSASLAGRLAWETSAALPRGVDEAELVHATLAGATIIEHWTDRELFVHNAEYEPGSTRILAASEAATRSPAGFAATALSRLEAAGWEPAGTPPVAESGTRNGAAGERTVWVTRDGLLAGLTVSPTSSPPCS
jgi:hypothetical protein